MRQTSWRALAALTLVGFASLTSACGDDTPAAPTDTVADTTTGDTRAPADTATLDPQCVDAGFNQACDDGNPCTTDDRCIEGRCRGALKTCDDDDPCTDDSCDPASGCTHVPNTASCDDGDPCTVQDRCDAGSCHGRAASHLACNDGDPCTINDECNEGVCAGQPNPCDDLNPCTADACDPNAADADPGTHCVHHPLSGSCDDGDPCTVDDVCVDSHCEGQIAVGKACNDGDLCTEGATCQADGSCGGGQARDCDDGDPCTEDLCNPAFGCRNPPDIGHPCDDGSLCTTDDACDDDGVCVGIPTECQPANHCKIGVCDEETGGCVVSDLDCDDHNDCTNDSCDPATGCVNTPNANPCDDGSLCTTDDHCADGICQGTAVECDSSGDDTCHANLCDPDTGECGWKNFDGSLCSDGDPCTNSDVCSGGTCVGIIVTCQDGDPCTDDYCDEIGVCQHIQLSEEECGDVTLDRANEYRALVNLPMLTNQEAIITAATNHCEYYVNNPEPYDAGLSPHSEDSGYDGFTGTNHGERMAAAGYTGQASFEVMAFINDPVRSVDEWMATLYHRIPFVLPNTLEMGYGAAEQDTRRCDTIDFGSNPDGDPAWEGLIIPFPPDGLGGVPVSWDGAESPQPPLPNPYPSGPILTVTFAGQNSYPTVTLLDSDIHGPDGPVEHVAYTEATDDSLCCGIISLYPVAPLQTFTTYTVVVDYTRDDTEGSFQWSFTTGNGSNPYFIP